MWNLTEREIKEGKKRGSFRSKENPVRTKMDKEDKEERERNCKHVQILHNQMILYNGDMVVHDFMCSHTFLVRNLADHGVYNEIK